MCRWIAYLGPELPLDQLLIKPSHSLLSQSKHALQSTFPINADGFGVGWYSPMSDTPGVYHETRPAWNDENLASLSSHISSPLFMAHIRAATSIVSRTNCHPFNSGKWLFQHNGVIGDFARMRHQLEASINDDIYAAMRGCTDSETMFGLCLSEGLNDDPPGAIERMIARVESARRQFKVEEAFRMTVALSDGCQLWAARYQSDGDGPSLYHTSHQAAVQGATGHDARVESEATIVVSEPLDEVSSHWIEVPGHSLVQACPGEVQVRPLETAL